MRITNLDLPKKPAAVQPQRPAGQQTKAREAQDACELLISPRGRLFTAARAAYSTSAAQRAERVAQVAQQVQTGTLEIDLAKLSDALIQHVVQEAGS